MDAVRGVLLNLLGQGYDQRAWHGPCLRETLRGVEVRMAMYRPSPRRKNIWEQVMHAAYWKHQAWATLVGKREEPFALQGKNWFRQPVAGKMDTAAWLADLALLEAMHVRLREAVEELPARKLGKVLGPEWLTPIVLIGGVAMHDVYHAGQVQLLKRLARGKGKG